MSQHIDTQSKHTTSTATYTTGREKTMSELEELTSPFLFKPKPLETRNKNEKLFSFLVSAFIRFTSDISEFIYESSCL